QNTPSIGYSMTVHRRRECSAGLWFAFLIEAGPHAVNYPLSLHDALPICGQVGQLEEYLGVTLFQRRPFALTPPGEKLYKFIQPFFSNLETVATELQGGNARQIRVGASTIVLRDHLPDLFQKMRKKFPNLK